MYMGAPWTPGPDSSPKNRVPDLIWSWFSEHLFPVSWGLSL